MQPQFEIVDDPDEPGSSEHGTAGGNGVRESLEMGRIVPVYESAGQGKLIDFARIGQSFATSDHPHDVDTSRVRCKGRAKGTSCHPSMTCGPLTPSPSTKRFCERADMVMAPNSGWLQTRVHPDSEVVYLKGFPPP